MLAGRALDLVVAKFSAKIFASPGNEKSGNFILGDISLIVLFFDRKEGLQVSDVEYLSVKSFCRETPTSEFQNLVTVQQRSPTIWLELKRDLLATNENMWKQHEVGLKLGWFF